MHTHLLYEDNDIQVVDNGKRLCDLCYLHHFHKLIHNYFSLINAVSQAYLPYVQ